MKYCKVLIFRQQLQAILQRIFSGREREFVDETFERESRLQRVDGAHPAQRHWSFGHHVFDGVVRDAVDRAGFVGQIGIDTVRNGLTFLPADRGRDDAMRECDWKSRPSSVALS